MSRPKKLKYKHGEITLSGFSKEENAEIEAKLLKDTDEPVVIKFDEKAQIHVIEPSPGDIKYVPATGGVCDKKAYAFVKVNQDYKMVIVAYNLEHGNAVVEKIEELGTNRNIADSKFSVKITREFFS